MNNIVSYGDAQWIFIAWINILISHSTIWLSFLFHCHTSICHFSTHVIVWLLSQVISHSICQKAPRGMNHSFRVQHYTFVQHFTPWLIYMRGSIQICWMNGRTLMTIWGGNKWMVSFPQGLKECDLVDIRFKNSSLIQQKLESRKKLKIPNFCLFNFLF